MDDFVPLATFQASLTKDGLRAMVAKSRRRRRQRTFCVVLTWLCFVATLPYPLLHGLSLHAFNHVGFAFLAAFYATLWARRN